MPEPNTSNSLQLLDQLSSVCSDFLISHPLTNLKYQCQANTTAHNKHINPLSAIKLFFSQLNTHGILPLYLKGLQPHCAYITIEGILKKVMIELVSEVSGVDLNLLKSSSSSDPSINGSPNPTSVSEIKYSITSYILKFFAETLKTIGLTTFYSSNLLLKINSLIASDQDQKLDYSMLLDFFRVSWNRVFTDTSLTEGYHSSSFSFGKLILPTILSVGLESALYSVLRPFVAFVFRLIVEGDGQSKKDGSKSGKNVEEESSRVDQFIEVYDRRKFYHERYIDLRCFPPVINLKMRHPLSGCRTVEIPFSSIHRLSNQTPNLQIRNSLNENARPRHAFVGR